ncbi:MAG: adenosylmethionine--8-amino-7-oxononanoate transaminase [Alphaproteobacteria bacterium]|nr:adenosylmethionine--8-amino-7-oxononanoate transaminase [Alphaproteobacteria bacterium]
MDQRAPAWLSAGWEHIWLPYAQMKTAPLPLAIVGAEGARLKLADGRELLDGVASWWTAAHGYNHPHIRDVVGRQLATLPHVMLGGLAHEQAYVLASRLAKMLPGDLSRVFFTDSGSVAVEVALKMAIQFWINRGEPGRTKVVSFKQGYHGDTFGTMAICDPDEGMHSLFKGVLAEQFVVDLPTDAARAQALDDVLTRHRSDIAAVIVEPLVQGAGGMKFHSAATLRAIADAARRHGVLFILDEIFTGFARTGSMFAMDEAGLVPDIVCLGKALTGGTLPLAATVASAWVFEGFLSDSSGAALMHGPTYMGNALACASANASLDLFEREPRLEQAARIEGVLKRELEAARGMPGVKDVRVKGAIGVIELDRLDTADARRRLIEHGVWVRPFGNIVYTTPPLIISDAELTTLTDAMVDVVREITVS